MTDNKRFNIRLVDKWPYVLALFIFVAFTFAGCQQFIQQSPIAIIQPLSSTVGEAPLTVRFSGSQSSDPDGTIASFKWKFDDGTSDTGQTVSHEFTGQDRYKVVLTVTDNDGLIGKDHIIIDTESNPTSIYFASNRVQTASYEVYKMDTDGNHQSRVTNDPDYVDLWPDLTRNTRGKLAFASDRNDPLSCVGTFNIFTANTDGSLTTNLTTQTAYHNIQPSWNPNGDKIAYASNKSSNWEIYKINADGIGSPIQVTTQTPYFAIAPAWSPVNDDLVFISDKNASGNTSIWILKDGATSPSKLYDSSGQDGALGLTMCSIPGNSFCGGRPPRTHLPNWVGISTPSWSPEGSKLAFTTNQGGNPDIYIYDFSTDTASALDCASDSGYEEFDPFWFKDSDGTEWIAFVSNRPSGSDYHIWKVKADGSCSRQQLTTIGSKNVTPSNEPWDNW